MVAGRSLYSSFIIPKNAEKKFQIAIRKLGKNFGDSEEEYKRLRWLNKICWRTSNEPFRHFNAFSNLEKMHLFHTYIYIHFNNLEISKRHILYTKQHVWYIRIRISKMEIGKLNFYFAVITIFF